MGHAQEMARPMRKFIFSLNSSTRDEQARAFLARALARVHEQHNMRYHSIICHPCPAQARATPTQNTQQPPSTLGLSRAPPRPQKTCQALTRRAAPLRAGANALAQTVVWGRAQPVPDAAVEQAESMANQGACRRGLERASGGGERRPLPRREEPVLMRTGGKIYGCDWMRVACPLVRDLPSGQDAIQRCCRRSIWARAPHMRDGLFELSGCTHAPAALWHLRTCLGNVLLHIYPRDSLQRQYKGCML